MKRLSLKEYDWIVGKTVSKNASKDEIIDLLTSERGVKTKKQKLKYFDPPDPADIPLKDFCLSNNTLQIFISRIEKALADKEKVVVYGDYDADGICATAILWEALHEIGLDVQPFIPSRFEEGYGLSTEGLDKSIKEFDPSLVITVDNGIVALDAVDYASQFGIDVIITDHHQRSDKLPAAQLIVHTTITSGAGIAYLLASCLSKHFRKLETSKGLDLCAIGIVSDQVSLEHPNRSLVSHGLVKLNETKRPGLVAIYDQAGIKNTPKSVYDIGYVIAPRINAAGRLDSAMDSLRLLCTTSSSRATELATILGTHNRRRQEIVSDVLIESEKMAEKKQWKGAIVVANKSFHEGVIGLAASRLAEKYNRPAIVFSVGTQESKASGRSIEGFDLIQHIRKLDKYLLSAGGHPGAAGFTIRTDELDNFMRDFEMLSARTLGGQTKHRTLHISLGIEPSQVNSLLLHELKKFEPTGMDNEKPLFTTNSVEIVSYKLVGSDQKHLKLILRKDGKTLDAIAFGFGKYFTQIAKTELIDVAYYVEENLWNGVSTVDLRITDIRI